MRGLQKEHSSPLGRVKNGASDSKPSPAHCGERLQYISPTSVNGKPSQAVLRRGSGLGGCKWAKELERRQNVRPAHSDAQSSTGEVQPHDPFQRPADRQEALAIMLLDRNHHTVRRESGLGALSKESGKDSTLAAKSRSWYVAATLAWTRIT